MKLSLPANELYEGIADLTIIDAHEHLPSEEEYLSHGYSGPNMFAGYVWHDLESAGMDSEFKATMRDDGERSVKEWWPRIKPYWEMVKHGSYARALLITARDLFGLEDINDATIDDFAAKVRADNTPGLYRRILRERCGIRHFISTSQTEGFAKHSILRGIFRFGVLEVSDSGIVSMLSERAGKTIQSLDEAVDAMQAILRSKLEDGALGFKTLALDFEEPNVATAAKEFTLALNAPEDKQPLKRLRDYLFDKFLDVAAEADVPVAVHAGYWGDFRKLDPKHLLSFALRRRDVRFDLFHLGMPMIREAALIGKTLPNVSLNLTWCPVISQLQTKRALDEIIDLVPMNKIIAFGGDYRTSVQKVYGHLVMAREVVAAVLAERIKAGDFDQEMAMHMARMWFHDNPSRIYDIDSKKR